MSETAPEPSTVIDPAKRTLTKAKFWKAPLPARSHIVRIVDLDGTVLRQTLQNLTMYIERAKGDDPDTIQVVSVVGLNIDTYVEILRVLAKPESPAWIGWTPGADWFREEIEQHGIAIAAGVFFLNNPSEFVATLENTIPGYVNEVSYDAEIGDAVELDKKTGLPLLPQPEVYCQAGFHEWFTGTSEAEAALAADYGTSQGKCSS